MRTAWWSQGITQNSYGEPLVFLFCYPSSLNHGSVENGCISIVIVSFHLGDQISTEPWLSCWWLNPTPLKNMLVMGSSSPNFQGENHKNMWVATTRTCKYYSSQIGSFPTKICGLPPTRYGYIFWTSRKKYVSCHHPVMGEIWVLASLPKNFGTSGSICRICTTGST